MSDFIKPQRIEIDAMPYLSKILGKGIIKDLQQHQRLCSVCEGTGLALENRPYGLQGDPDKSAGHFPYQTQYVGSCPKCFAGVVNLCEFCGKELKRFDLNACMCEQAAAQRRAKEAALEQATLDKATKLTVDDEIAKGMGMFYHESYPYNEGYFSDIAAFIEWWHDTHEPDEERPQYVWGTTTTKLTLNANRILEDATDDLHEEAFNNITNQAELQEFLDAWCAKQQGTATYYHTEQYAIQIPWEAK